MRNAITQEELTRRIIEEAMGPPPASPGSNSIVHQLKITRLPAGKSSAKGANWEGTDGLGNEAVTAAIGKAQNMYDLS